MRKVLQYFPESTGVLSVRDWRDVWTRLVFFPYLRVIQFYLDMDTENLYQLFIKHPVVTTDSRHCPEGSLFFALKGERFDGNQYAAAALEKGCAYAVIDNPEYLSGDRTILVDDTLRALQALAREHRDRLGLPVIGITGTNGKTTTKELIAAVLSTQYNLLYTEGNLNNHIGVPLTLLRLRETHQLAVIEMGASHPGDIRELVEIADVRALYQGSNVTVSEDWYIRATVISNVDLNNGSSKKNIVMQDETAGIMVRLTQDEEAFKLGDVVEVNIQGQSLENFNGLIQLNNVPNANISKVSDGTVPEPKNITAAQLISGDYESQYVAVSDVQVVAEDLGKTFVMNNSNTSITFESRTGETFDLFTSRWAESLKSVQVPEGSGTLKGIAGINKDTYQISLTSTDDYAGLTGERFGEAAYTFSINPTSQRVSSEGGSFDITVTSNVAWTVSSDNSAFTVNPTSGNGNGTVTVQYTANTDASERTATITVSTTDENIANKTLTCSVTQSAQGASTDEPVVATIAEVLAAEVNDNVWYQITGMITNIENTSYGNFTIEDETGSIYVWGLTAEKVDKNDQSFSTLGLSEGDILTLVGTRDEHYGDPQVGGPAYYISHEEGELPETPVVLITGTEGDGIYTSSVDLTQPSVNSNDEKWNNYEFTIGGEDYPAIKIGTSSVPGAYSFNLGKSGSCTLTMYAIAWNGKKTHAKVEISGGGTINGMSYVELDCQANSGLAGSDTTLPITFGTKDFYTMSIEGATESTVITVTTDGMANERIGFTGVNVK